ncbi:MAG: anaerobic ribonucleoside triphosphate reductase [Eubacteriales bacterium]|jgi:anaerobic ribonucleoside-triphosphate reductase
MITKIRKRDGREVPFNIEKIANAIFKAAKGIGGNDYDTAFALAEKVVDYLEEHKNSHIYTVEEVQDVVEKILIENGHAKTAKTYILYRAERTRAREMSTRLMKIYEDLTFKSAAENDVKRENANIDGDTSMGTMLKYGSEGSKNFCEMFILEKKFADAHIHGDIHIHDMDFYTLTTTCCQIDLNKLFEGGFSTGHGHLREPNDIRSYSALACIAIQSNQNDQHGGQSIPLFDYYLSKGVAKTYKKKYRKNLAKALEIYSGQPDLLDYVKGLEQKLEEEQGLAPVLSNHNDYTREEAKLLADRFSQDIIDKSQKFALKYAVRETDRDTYQAMEALVHNLNTMHSRAGAQIPFSSINYGTDTSAEGRLIIKNVLLATEAGLGNGETPIFPIHIFKVKEGVNYNPGDPNYDLFKLACRVSAKRLFPNFSFLDAPYNLQYYKEGDPDTEIAYMGCRTRVIANHYDPTHEIVTGRGNLSFTSINLPRLGILAEGNVDRFFEMLEEKVDLVAEQLMARYKIQAQKCVRNYPFLMGQGIWLGSENLGPNDRVGEVLKHGTLTLGFIGLAECLKALMGQHHGESQEAQEMGLRIVGFMRKKMDEYTEKTGFNYSLIATPAEGLSGRFIRIDQKRFGRIPGVTDRNYYTNSFHIPVYFDINAFEKIRREAPYHALTNGGHISYIELDGDPCDNLEAFETVVRCMKESGIGYGSINHPVDRDPVCGYNGIIGDVCPRCGRHEGEAVSVEKLKKLGVYKNYNSSTIGYHGDNFEEADRQPNQL